MRSVRAIVPPHNSNRGESVTTFTVASNEFLGGGKEKAEYQHKERFSPR
jgi:hypothetical protein